MCGASKRNTCGYSSVAAVKTRTPEEITQALQAGIKILGKTMSRKRNKTTASSVN